MPAWTPVGLARGLESLAFSGGIAAAFAGTMALASALALGLSAEPAAIALAVCGTLVIYGIDRLRDTARDRTTAPERTAFVLRHARGLGRATAMAALASGGLMLTMPAGVWALCGAVLALGLLHRRLKRRRRLKLAYVTAAWVAVTVGVPAWSAVVGAAGLRELALAAAIAGGAVGANLLACNASSAADARDLRPAFALAAAGCAIAWAAPGTVGHLGWVPAAELAALAVFRPGERFRLIGLDGSLWLGAATACLHTLGA